MSPDLTPLLLEEGDRLTRRLAQLLDAPLSAQPRVQFLGRSLAYNLLRAYPETAERISRQLNRPHRAELTADDRGRLVIRLWASGSAGTPPDPLAGLFDLKDQDTTDAPGPVRPLADLELAGDDLLEAALFTRGHLHPDIRTLLAEALTGSEHAATRQLVACLKSRPVLSALERTLKLLLPRR